MLRFLPNHDGTAIGVVFATVPAGQAFNLSGLAFGNGVLYVASEGSNLQSVPSRVFSFDAEDGDILRVVAEQNVQLDLKVVVSAASAAAANDGEYSNRKRSVLTLNRCIYCSDHAVPKPPGETGRVSDPLEV